MGIDTKSKRTAIIIALLFVALNCFLYSKEIYTFSFFPLILAAALAFIAAPLPVFFLLIAITPLSIPLREFYPDTGIDIWLPSEIGIALFFGLVLLKSIYDRSFDTSLLRKPIFPAIVLYLLWLIIATLNSKLPVVSAKYTVLRIIYITVLFYLPYTLFRQKPRYIFYFIALFTLGLATVVLISLNTQLARGLFDKHVAHGACNPFFTDHTSYGAALAFIIPVLLSWALIAKRRSSKLLLGGAGLFFLFALILSYSRAAWLSLIVSGGIWLLILLRIKLRTVLISGIVGVLLLLSFQDELAVWLQNNQTASSGNLKQHIQSIANIRTDDSNVERINRWTCAVRMFKEKPLLGWGPGSYMFLYSPFQSSYLKTAESSNLGKKGNAHSEYLGLLSEAGVPALLAFVSIYIITFAGAYRKIGRLPRGNRWRIILLGLILGFTTYTVHGFLNNFLDMDKIATLFWGFIAFIAAFEPERLGVELKSED